MESQCIVISCKIMDSKEIGEIIRSRRKSLKINQPTLAMLADVGLNTLLSIEKGKGNPKIETILSILDTLGLQINITLKD